MADDDGIDDLLEGMDDLDAALFGKSSTAPKKTPPKNMLSSILANQPASSTSTDASRRPTVSFMEPSAPRTAPSRSTLNDLFGDSSSTPQPAATPAPREPRRATQNLNDLFGSSRKPEPTPQSQASTPQKADTPPTARRSEETSSLDAGRIRRLEAEIERLNRELDDVKRRKRDDEEDLERLWKDRLEKSVRDHEKQSENMKIAHQNFVEKIETDQKNELDRLKSNYDRQLDSLTSSLSQTKDIITVVERVDNISTAIERIAGDVSASSGKMQSEQETVLRIREEKLKLREERFQEDIKRFESEREKILELNIRLNEICKAQESSTENDKWKLRDEWKRYNAEKQVFREDQKFVLENLSRDKALFETKITKFHQEQHDLLVRVSTERQLLEQEKNEFYAKRNLDIRRIKEEAADLDVKIQQVVLAEQHLEESKINYEAKFRQLQDLEISLMEECSEIDRLRNRLHASAVLKEKQETSRYRTVTNTNPSRYDNNIDVEQSNRESYRKNDSVRAVLKKHSEYLDKYVGQKVAAIAPQNN